MRRSLFLTTISLVLLFQTALTARAQDVMTSRKDSIGSAIPTRQHHYDKHLPAGNYSGVAHIGHNRYAVASDKSPQDGFFIFQIDLDSISGEILSARNEGFFGDSLSCRDAEGIAFLPRTNTVIIVGEEDSRIVEYDLSGRMTGRTVQLEQARGNVGYESLTYNDSTATIWTCTENALERDRRTDDNASYRLLRLQSFDLNLAPLAQYVYRMDEPQSHKRHRYYAHGVSEMTALDDGSLLILEREVHVPKRYVGSTVQCKLFRVMPNEDSRISNNAVINAYTKPLTKTLLCQWQSRLNLTARSFANYEGVCVAPPLADGSQVILLVADSQNRIRGVLHDWMRTVVIRK